MHVKLAQTTVACSIHIPMILYVGILNVRHHISVKITSGATMRGESVVDGEWMLAGV